MKANVQHELGSSSEIAPALDQLRPWRAAAAAVIALALSLQFYIVWRSSSRELAMTPYLLDDAFIAATVSRNVSQGKGFSFDGEAPTTGVTPLWTLILAPIYAALDDELALKVQIISSAVCAAWAIWLLFIISLEFLPPLWALCAAATCSFTAGMFFQALNGMDTWLFALLGLFILARYRQLPQCRNSLRPWFVLGIAAAGLAWVRAEGALLTLSIVVVECLALIRRPRGRRATLRGLALLLLVAGVVATPVYYRNFRDTGTFGPANQVGRKFIADAVLPVAPGVNGKVNDVAARLGDVAGHLRILAGSAVLGLLGTVGLAARGGRWSPPIAVLLLFTVASTGLLAGYQRYVFDVHGLRYAVFPAMVFIAGVFRLILDCLHWWCPWTGRRATAAAALLLTLAMVTHGWFAYNRMWRNVFWTSGRNVLPWRSSERERAQLFAPVDYVLAHLGPDARIAAKDNGLLAFYTRRPVLDLAGILDPQVIGHIQARTLACYLVQRRVQFLALPNVLPSHYLCRALGMSGGDGPAAAVLVMGKGMVLIKFDEALCPERARL